MGAVFPERAYRPRLPRSGGCSASAGGAAAGLRFQVNSRCPGRAGPLSAEGPAHPLPLPPPLRGPAGSPPRVAEIAVRRGRRGRLTARIPPGIPGIPELRALRLLHLPFIPQISVFLRKGVSALCVCFFHGKSL